MTAESTKAGPGAIRRVAAIAALLLTVAVVALTIVDVAREPLWLILVIALLAIAAIALWYSVRRAKWRAQFGAAVAVVAAGAAIAIVIYAAGWRVLEVALLLLMAFLLARFALGENNAALKSQSAALRVGPARRATLIMNSRSGGGKAQRFGLERECRRRGIEPVTLTPGDDIRELAERAVRAGADVIGVAGGDGSIALVAGVATAHNVALVIVPAGTFNHFALDLGLDRDDVVGALDAFGEALERRVDLGEVNGRLFVNNVSLGIYASLVRRPEYRTAKIDTTLNELPRLLGPGSHPFDLRFVTCDGERWENAHLVQISNGPYGRNALALGTRPRLDSGELGIITLVLPDQTAERRLLEALASGKPEGYEGFKAWSAPEFELGSCATISAGIDGESVELEPPLRFASRPLALRVRLPRSARGYSPAAYTERVARGIPDLWRIAVAGGRPTSESGERSFVRQQRSGRDRA